MSVDEARAHGAGGRLNRDLKLTVLFTSTTMAIVFNHAGSSRCCIGGARFVVQGNAGGSACQATAQQVYSEHHPSAMTSGSN